mmetsp:Transcript_8765/g.26352  ORF Transcript_8765/g.26352 Transcript_8765/m.26352 type:complete len:261 (-) Transcript_8765:142-924(-)
MCITRLRATEVLCVDFCSSGLCMLQALEDEQSTPLPHHEAIALLIPRSARLLGLVVSGGDCATGDETAKSHRNNRRLRASRQHEVSLAVHDVHRRVVDCKIACCTGGGQGVVWPHEAELDCKKATAHVRDRVGNEERRDPGVAPSSEGFRTSGVHRHAAHATSAQNAAPALVERLFGVRALCETGILKGLFSTYDRVNQKRVQSPRQLRADVSIGRHCSRFDLRRNTRAPSLGVEPLHHLHAALPLQQRVVVDVRVRPEA